MKKTEIYYNSKYHLFNATKKKITNLGLNYIDEELEDFCHTTYDFTINNIKYFLKYKIYHPVKLLNDILFVIKTQQNLDDFLNSKEEIFKTYTMLLESDLHNWLEPTVMLFGHIIFYDPTKKYLIVNTPPISPEEKYKKSLSKFGKIILDDYDNLHDSGIYRFYNSNKKLIYVGKGYLLSKRIFSSAIERQAIYYDYCIISNKSDTDIYEIYYITKLKPKLNYDCNNKDILSITLPELKFTEIKPLYDSKVLQEVN